MTKKKLGKERKGERHREKAVKDGADLLVCVLLCDYLIVNNRPQRCERPFIRPDRVINPCWENVRVCMCL